MNAPHDPTTLSAALAALERGWFVFPVRRDDKRPYTLNGFKDATTDRDQIMAWWRQWPSANPAIDCGRSKLVVVDIDDPHAEIELRHMGPLPPTYTVRTGRDGGTHLYFGAAQRRVTNRTGTPIPKVDIRADGGYVVAAGAIHETGARYTVAADVPPVALPRWLLDAIAPEKKPQSQPRPKTTGGVWRGESDRGEVLRRFAGVIQRLAGAGIGHRNNEVYYAAHAAGRLSHSGLSEAFAVSEIRTIAGMLPACPKEGPLTEREIEATIRSGWSTGVSDGPLEDRPRDTSRRVGRAPATENAGDPPCDPETGEILEPEREIAPWSEVAMAERFIQSLGVDWRYCRQRGMWLRWDSCRWQWDEKHLVFSEFRRLVRTVATDYFEEPAAQARLSTASKAGAVQRFSECDPAVAISIDELDSDPWILNTPGGVVDLRTGEIAANQKDSLCSKCTGASPAQAGWESKTWQEFLDTVTEGDEDLERFLQRMCGYCLTGSTREHALFFLHGPGANGKSVFLNAISGVLGDYATTSPMETFTETKNDRHPTEIARLRGARMVSSVETEEGRAWAESKLKQLTGGDRIAARFLHRDYFEFSPAFKLIIIGNHKPALRNVGEAEKRRFNLVPFTAQIPPEKRDKDLDKKIRGAWPEILRWMIDGCLAWQRDGLNPPSRVSEATETYFETEDVFARWIEDTFILRPDVWEPSGQVFSSWKYYAEANNETVGTQRALTMKLTDRGFASSRETHQRIRSIRGLKFKTAAEVVTNARP